MWATTIAAAAAAPNIVFFLADDMGYGDAGYLSTAPPERKLRTPSMDRMVQDGMSFTEAYAGAPVCAPSRCTLITGRHSGHCTIRSNGPALNSTDVGVAQVLKKAGYRTVHIGKWGLGIMSSNESSPMAKGFDEYYGQVDQNYCHDYYPYEMDSNRKVSGQQGLKEYLAANKGANPVACGKDHLKCRWSGDEWSDVSNQWLMDEGKRRAAGDKTPFFMYLSFTAPHAGGIGTTLEGQPPVPGISTGPYANSSYGKEVGYASAVTAIDTKLGLYFETLKKAGLDEDTITFFSSDNGASNEGNHDYQFFTSSGALQGYKRSLHEGGHRTPLVVTWPGKIVAGTRSLHQFAFYDFLATAAELAGVTTDALPSHDGTSIVPTLMGKGQDLPPFVYHEYCAPNEKSSGWGQSVRIGNWSAVCVGDKLSSGKIPACDVPLLYDLGLDLGQTKDVAAENPDVVAQAMQIMRDQHEFNPYCGAPVPTEPFSLTDLHGAWVQTSSGNPAMTLTITNATDTQADLTLTCVEPCTCCNWRTAAGTVKKTAAGGADIDIKATGPQSFVATESGAAVKQEGAGLHIVWSGSRQWANWVKSEVALV